MSLTKSLHTVTAVSRVAAHLAAFERKQSPERLTLRALRVLGYEDVDVRDETVMRCVEATKKLIAKQ